MFALIAAVSKNGGLGINGKIPWNKSQDRKHFRDTTSNSTIIMGRKTFDTFLSPKGLSSFNRTNIVISKTMTSDLVHVHRDFDFSQITKEFPNQKFFVIGGGQLYEKAIKDEHCNEIILTRLNEEYTCDVFFPSIPSRFQKYKSVHLKDDDVTIEYYHDFTFDSNFQEIKYLHLLENIIKQGEVHGDRTGVGTSSLFAQTLTYSILCRNDGYYEIPCFTTKRVFVRGVIEELLWFLRGETNAKILHDKGVTIWDGNSSKEFLLSRGLDYEEGECGPIYGKQWVNWNGTNQIAEIINTLRNDPTCRRMVLSAWNVSDLSKMSLPPCHLLYIFKVTRLFDKRPKLNCLVILRSCDMFLGHPFNLLSASILTLILAKCVGFDPGDISFSMADCHIYNNHIKQVNTQILRQPFSFPKIKLDVPLFDYDDIIKLKFEDFFVKDYHCWPSISAPMAV